MSQQNCDDFSPTGSLLAFPVSLGEARLLRESLALRRGWQGPKCGCFLRARPLSRNNKIRGLSAISYSFVAMESGNYKNGVTPPAG